MFLETTAVLLLSLLLEVSLCDEANSFQLTLLNFFSTNRTDTQEERCTHSKNIIVFLKLTSQCKAIYIVNVSFSTAIYLK